jgi:hypothetical protein
MVIDVHFRFLLVRPDSKQSTSPTVLPDSMKGKPCSAGVVGACRRAAVSLSCRNQKDKTCSVNANNSDVDTNKELSRPWCNNRWT